MLFSQGYSKPKYVYKTADEVKVHVCQIYLVHVWYVSLFYSAATQKMTTNQMAELKWYEMILTFFKSSQSDVQYKTIKS